MVPQGTAVVFDDSSQYFPVLALPDLWPYSYFLHSMTWHHIGHPLPLWSSTNPWMRCFNSGVFPNYMVKIMQLPLKDVLLQYYVRPHLFQSPFVGSFILSGNISTVPVALHFKSINFALYPFLSEPMAHIHRKRLHVVIVTMIRCTGALSTFTLKC